MKKAKWTPTFPAPEGYIAWHEWAERQHRAGLRQKKCGLCSKFRFPVEMSERTISGTSKGMRHGVLMDMPWTAPVCRHCDEKSEAPSGAGGAT